MIVLVLTIFLYAMAATLALVAWRRKDGTLRVGLRESWTDFVHLIPRLLVGVLGAGFIARLLPQDMVIAWFGPGSGPVGLVLASIAGAIVPGGPVVGFAMGAAALKAGAGVPQVVAFVTAWSLYTLNRILVWELPVMNARFVWMRAAISLPFPFIAALVAGLWLNGSLRI